MTRIPDIVRDFKLQTQFQNHGAETIHTYHESDLASGRRVVVRLEHWQRQHEVGSGSYGQVWLEKCTKGGRALDVRAVKQLPTNGHIDYHRELEAITRFSHQKYDRCFTTSFGWFETPTHLFIAMEYLERGDLLAYVKGRPPLPEREAKVIASQIVEALTMMHENAFVHGDLKPNNILIMSHPPDIWWVKLSDFGLSKRIEEASGASTLLKGTPGYIAPELYELTERGSPYAPDIWAVGATLFFMLVKRPAFDSLGRLAKYATDIEGFPSGLLADVGATHLCIEFIESLMGVRPKDRAPADVAIHHKWLKEMNTPPPSRAGSGFPLDSPPSPKALSTGLSTEEFAPWDTVSSRQTSNDTLKHGPHEGTREDFNIPIQRDSIKLSGGKIRVAKELFHRGCEGEAVFSADSTVLAVAGSKNPLRLWDMSSYSEIPGLKARLCIAFSPDGKLFASCGLFNYLQLWDAPTRTALESHNLTGYPQSVIFSPDSKMVACAVNDTVFFRHVAEGSNLRKFKFHIALESRPLPIHLAFSSDSKSIWLARADKFQKLEIDQDTPKHCFRLPVGGDALGISADGQYIAYLDPARTRNICLMELSTRRMVLEIKSKFIHSRVAFSHKAKLFAVYESGRSYNRGILSLWDLDAKEELSATTCRSSVQSIAFSPDDTMIASTSRYGSTLLWVADTRSE